MHVAPISLLEAWERAAPLPASTRPLALLALAGNADQQELALLPLGARDAELLRLRQRLFGDHMACLTTCPKCSIQLELALHVKEFLQYAADQANVVQRIEHNGYVVHFRILNSTDLETLSFDGDTAEVGECILDRCVIDACDPAGPLKPAQLPPDLAKLVEEEIERLDPLAATWLDLECRECGHTWHSLFDIASLLWIEIDRQAHMLLQEVHQLAQAYGWAERDILQMSTARRHNYLRMVGP